MSFRQLTSAGTDGGSCGDDVVDQEDVLVGYALGISEVEYPVYITQPVQCALLRLTFRKLRPLHHIIIYRQASDIAHPSGYHHTLIVAPLPLPETSDGHGNNGIDAFEEPFCSKLQGSQLAHGLTHLRTRAVFHVEDERADLTLGFIEEQRSSTLDRHDSPKETCQRIVEGLAFEACSRQMKMTDSAQHLLVGRKSTTTDGTGAW